MFVASIVHQLTQQNLFGKTQSDLDIEADKIIFEQLKKSGVVHSAASEEKPYVSNE
jgi:fructose-1,6-bisphosphatase